MTDNRHYDLEERTLTFARDVRALVKKLPRTTAHYEDSKQLIRSSGSVGANYIEANEALGRKDFIMKAKISRKEAKESRYWLKLIDTDNNDELDKVREYLVGEALELTRILSRIVMKRFGETIPDGNSKNQELNNK